MEWRNAAAADLPEPRAGDPPRLRNDILDELADHLACAADREKLRGGEDDEIAARVRERFGDPARIARQLWLDALKERLMAQRITAIFAAVVALAAVIACGLLWSAVRDTRESLALALEQSREQAVAHAESNAALLARIKELSQQADQPAAASMEWNPVRVKLVKGENGTEPAVGYTATLTGALYKGGEQSSISHTADETGILDFGRVQPGRYGLRVQTPWNAFRSFSIQVLPGTSVEQTIACPADEIFETDVRLEVDWPDELPETIDAAIVTFYGPVQPFRGEDWSLPGNTRRSVLVERDGTLTWLPSAFDPRTRSTPAIPGVVPSSTVFGNIRLITFDRAGFDRFGGSEAMWVEWRTGLYRLSDVALISEEVAQRFLADLASRSSGRGFGLFGRRPGSVAAGLVSFATSESPPDAEDLTLHEPRSFTPAAEQENVWRITLPPAMVEQARERLEQFEAALEAQRQESEAQRQALEERQRGGRARQDSAVEERPRRER